MKIFDNNQVNCCDESAPTVIFITDGDDRVICDLVLSFLKLFFFSEIVSWIIEKQIFNLKKKILI